MRLSREERGSGTVLALAGIAALLMLIGVVHVLGAAAVAAAQAGRAADLAALAAADAARGIAAGDPCTLAEQVAEHNGAGLSRCRIAGEHGTEAIVSTEVPVAPDLLGGTFGPWEATGTARAGPPPQEETAQPLLPQGPKAQNRTAPSEPAQPLPTLGT